MKMRRHRVFLLCTVGLCLISFLHYYKALHYVTLLRELSSPYPNIKSFFMVSEFFWKQGGTPLGRVEPEEAPQLLRTPSYIRELPLVQREENEPAQGLKGPRRADRTGAERGGARLPRPEQVLNLDPNTQPPAEDASERQRGAPQPDPPGGAPETISDLHRRPFVLQDKPNTYFTRTKAGAHCFRQGTETAEREGQTPPAKPARRQLLFKQQEEEEEVAGPRLSRMKRGRRLVKCVCRPGWHGPSCGVPTVVQHSNLPTKERLAPRDRPRRVINAINVNHEFDLLHARFHELADAVDVFAVCESNFTAYGERRPLHFLRQLLNGTYDYIRHKILYVFLDHFPEGGRQDGWVADDYLRTFLTRDSVRRIQGLRGDDVFIINDADEVPAREGVLFLKLFDGWTEPFAIHMRKSLYGFFWKQPGSLEVVSGCTVAMLRAVYETDGIKLRRREYYTLPAFRAYENDTGHILVQWSLGSPFHFAGWHCSWCFRPEGIYLKLVSAQNGDFPRWGDYEEKKDLNYIQQLIRTGGWFDGSVQEYPPADPKEHMYAPRYLLRNPKKYQYMLENPYRREGGG
ncbi:beta-1,4-mannosyl-glycoprotein 4-beta-N-acetylglucosaminyltransferase isoform X2 [Polyodon spathula]|nr:beta-1,4-mannosyl-glycoprotein 4-beta-N-acetylglucosaminyltransferase isoform X2 [Polyodon spathula]XP_041093742.1 beta-1,4-mannosyl-glycoprotein 4-beta-N-acetylglucosaminyltransferase isoform X2 [Polyodon spathula]